MTCAPRRVRARLPGFASFVVRRHDDDAIVGHPIKDLGLPREALVNLIERRSDRESRDFGDLPLDPKALALDVSRTPARTQWNRRLVRLHRTRPASTRCSGVQLASSAPASTPPPRSERASHASSTVTAYSNVLGAADTRAA